MNANQYMLYYSKQSSFAHSLFHISGNNMPHTIYCVYAGAQKVTFFFILFIIYSFSVEKKEKLGYNLHAQGLLSAKAQLFVREVYSIYDCGTE